MTDRRQFLVGTAACLASATLMPGLARAARQFDPQPGEWRAFRVVTRLEIPTDKGAVQAWVPLASVNDEWMQPLGEKWTGNAVSATIVTDPASGTKLLHATFANGGSPAVLEVENTVRMRDRSVAGTESSGKQNLSDSERQLYLAATDLVPTDGIVKKIADEITKGLNDDSAKAKAIYEWVVENCHRDGDVRGCGTGDVVALLETGGRGGKCADLNALFVGLARASGVPARDIYGVRVAPSRFGYKSLGANSDIVSKAQHCRAEVYLSGQGWVAADPADVRKVMLEEPPRDNAIDSPAVVAVREKLFGAWEGNWLAYNTGHDLVLPGSSHKVAFLMYPQAEVGGTLVDSLNPDKVSYTIKSTAI
jgi:transglutaminase-like putative cysteine protease